MVSPGRNGLDRQQRTPFHEECHAAGHQDLLRRGDLHSHPRGLGSGNPQGGSRRLGEGLRPQVRTHQDRLGRSEERRGGKERVSTCSTRWTRHNKKKKKKKI